MGDKRISIRTLPDGSKVRHHPPDAAHPEGKMVLVRDRSPLREKLAANHHHNRRRHAELQQDHHDRAEFKRAQQRANGVPAEKSPI